MKEKMNRKNIFMLTGLSIMLFLASCGEQADTEVTASEAVESLGTEETLDDTEQYELTELEQQIADFKEGTSSEITVIQDLLRGEWHIDGLSIIEEESIVSDNPYLGEAEISYDVESKYSNVVFTNSEFQIVYDDAEATIGDNNWVKLRSAISVSGLYRVTEPAELDEKNETYTSRIEMLITDISPKYGGADVAVYEQFESLIGKIVSKEVGFVDIYTDLSDLTEEQIAEYDFEIHDKVTTASGGYIGLKEGGGWGLIMRDTPLISQENPVTEAYFSGSDDDKQLFTGYMNTKMNNSVKSGDETTEPGVFLYDIVPHDDIPEE